MGEPEDFAAAPACGLCEHWTSRMAIHAMVGRCSVAQREVSALGTCPSHEWNLDYVERMVGHVFADRLQEDLERFLEPARCGKCLVELVAGEFGTCRPCAAVGGA